jgi:RNA polymerase sigma-54 factor
MKQGLSLRVSQHLALTPQLQQSIRLLQLSTLELGQEVEQMLDENPFLERQEDVADREAFGLTQADEPVSLGDRVSESAHEQVADPTPFSGGESGSQSSVTDAGDGAEAALEGAPAGEPDWEGDGSVDLAPDDSEWGSDAPARSQHALDDDEGASASDLAHEHVTLQAHLHRQALGRKEAWTVGRVWGIATASHFVLHSCTNARWGSGFGSTAAAGAWPWNTGRSRGTGAAR